MIQHYTRLALHHAQELVLIHIRAYNQAKVVDLL